MGWFDWFDDETIYSAGISITHLVPELPESPLKAAVLNAIRSDGSIVNNLVAARDKTLFSRAENFLEYVQANYPQTLPADDFPTTLGDPLPIITVRLNGSNTLDSDATTVEKNTKALSFLGVKLESLTDAVNTSPSAADDVFVMFGINVVAETPGSNEYFYYFLEKLYDPTRDAVWWQQLNPPTWGTGPGSGILLNELIFSIFPYLTYNIHYAGEFNFALTYATITKETIAGTVGTVGTVTKSYQDNLYIGGMSSVQMNKAGAVYSTVKVRFIAPGSYYYQGPYNVALDSITVTKQVSTTHCERYTIYGLVTHNTINTPNGPKYVNHWRLRGPGSIDANNSFGSMATFVLPMLKGVLDEINPFSQEQFLADSLILYVHSIDSTTIAWYQSAWFLDLVSIVLTVVSVFFASFTLAASSLTQLLVQVATAIAVGYAASALYDILAPLVGEEIAAVILFAAAVAASGLAGGGNLKLNNLPWAEELLKAALVTVDTVKAAVAEDTLQLSKDIAGFIKSSEEFYKELDKATDLLGTVDDNLKNNNINAILGFSETPEEFYNRTIHHGNIGILGIEAITKYVDNSLKLPKELSYT